MKLSHSPLAMHVRLTAAVQGRSVDKSEYSGPAQPASVPAKAREQAEERGLRQLHSQALPQRLVEHRIARLVGSRRPSLAAMFLPGSPPALDFKTGIREALAQQDRLSTTAKEPTIDSGLRDGLRQTLFAIRSHLSGVAATLESEGKVRRAISQTDQAIRDLEPMAAWSNRGDDGARFRDRAEREIDFIRTIQAEALASLPPPSSRAQDSFPALEKNVIVRIRPMRSRYARNTEVRCLQEVWRMESRMPGTREVRRIVTLILIDPRTGNQTTADTRTTLYMAPPGNLLEEVFDEYAADDIGLGNEPLSKEF